MNNLSELQGELHKLSAALDALSRQVEELKPRETDEAVDFAALEALARKNPIKNPSLAKAGEFEQDCYLRLASTAAFLTDRGQLDKLLYLCRLSAGSGCGQGAVELQKMAYDTERLEWKSAAVELKDLALPLLLDMMMLGSMTGPADERTLDFIAGVAELLNVSQEDAAVTAQLAAVLLEQNENAFGRIEAKRAYPELGYLVPEEWLISQRNFQNVYKICEEYEEREYEFKPTDSSQSPFNFRPFCFTRHAVINAQELILSGTFVEKGTLLLSFERKFAEESDQKIYCFVSRDPAPIEASRSGVVFFVEGVPNEKFIYFASPFDSDESISAWQKSQKKE